MLSPTVNDFVLGLIAGILGAVLTLNVVRAGREFDEAASDARLRRLLEWRLWRLHGERSDRPPDPNQPWRAPFPPSGSGRREPAKTRLQELGLDPFNDLAFVLTALIAGEVVELRWLPLVIGFPVGCIVVTVTYMLSRSGILRVRPL